MPATPSPLIPENPSPQLQVVFKWVEAVSNADMDLLGSIIVEDYVQLVLPASLNTPSMTSRDQIIKVYGGMLPLFPSFVVTIHEITGTPEKVILHVYVSPSSDSKFHALNEYISLPFQTSSESHTSFGYHYQNEYIFTFYVAQQTDGSFKITKVKEFTDAVATENPHHAIAKATAPPA